MVETWIRLNKLESRKYLLNQDRGMKKVWNDFLLWTLLLTSVSVKEQAPERWELFEISNQSYPCVCFGQININVMCYCSCKMRKLCSWCIHRPFIINSAMGLQAQVFKIISLYVALSLWCMVKFVKIYMSSRKQLCCTVQCIPIWFLWWLKTYGKAWGSEQILHQSK